jgi:hypothetical protein
MGGDCVSAFEAEGSVAVDVPTEAMPGVVITATPAPSLTTMPAETTESLPVVSPEFGVGAHVLASGTGGAGLGLFRDPAAYSIRMDVADDGEVFVVLDGPGQADGHTWWLLGDPEDEDRQGWAVACFLRPVENP